ncbi:MAG: SRPBCC family protein [Actinomycetes bacterium]
MAVGEASALVRRPATEILAFILDVEAYRALDPRLRTIKWVRRMPGDGFPVPAGAHGPTGTSDDPASHPDAGEAGGHHPGAESDGPVRGVRRAAGVHPGDGGTRVRRRLEFRFARSLSWLMDPLLTRWPARDVPAELSRLEAHLERPA